MSSMILGGCLISEIVLNLSFGELKEGREGVKWELGLAYFRLRKWDWGYRDWAAGNGK